MALALLVLSGCDPARENRKRIAEENSRLHRPVDTNRFVTVDFELNSDRLDGRARRMTRFAGRRAMADKTRKIVVAGYHAEGEPNRLAMGRATAVADRLKRDGVPASMIVAHTIGDLPPSSSTADISTCSGVYG